MANQSEARQGQVKPICSVRDLIARFYASRLLTSTDLVPNRESYEVVRLALGDDEQRFLDQLARFCSNPLIDQNNPWISFVEQSNFVLCGYGFNYHNREPVERMIAGNSTRIIELEADAERIEIKIRDKQVEEAKRLASLERYLVLGSSIDKQELKRRPESFEYIRNIMIGIF